MPLSFGDHMFWDKFAFTWRKTNEPDYDKIARNHYKALEEIILMGIGEELKEGQERGRKQYLEQSQDPNFTGGRKFDGGKLQYGLLPPLALRETVQVLTFGAQKYEPDNWKRVPEPNRRYFDAAERHVWAYKEGEKYDPESGVNHLAHAICCLMFMLDLDEQKRKDTVTKYEIEKQLGEK